MFGYCPFHGDTVVKCANLLGYNNIYNELVEKDFYKCTQCELNINFDSEEECTYIEIVSDRYTLSQNISWDPSFGIEDEIGVSDNETGKLTFILIEHFNFSSMQALDTQIDQALKVQ